MTANELHCTTCRRAGTWWELNTLACSHGKGCALDAGRTIVLVCGSRDWDDVETIRRRMRELPRETLVLHGAARGADQMAGTIALACGFDVHEYPADWDYYGRSAGFRRNIQMLDERPTLVLAFQRNGSTGTAGVIREARRRHIPVEVFSA